MNHGPRVSARRRKYVCRQLVFYQKPRSAISMAKLGLRHACRVACRLCRDGMAGSRAVLTDRSRQSPHYAITVVVD